MIDPAYTEYEGKEPREVFGLDGCRLLEHEETTGVSRIVTIQTKIPATVEIELTAGEEFDMKKLHFMSGEHVLSEYELRYVKVSFTTASLTILIWTSITKE